MKYIELTGLVVFAIVLVCMIWQSINDGMLSVIGY